MNRERRGTRWQTVSLYLACSCVVIGCKPSPPTPAASAPPTAQADSPSTGADEGPKAAPTEPPAWQQAAQPKLQQWRRVDGLPKQLAQFETVFWDAADSVSLREWLTPERCRGKRILEIGTGTGLISLWCLQNGAARVVATDINPNALANIAYNADHLGHPLGATDSRLELRWVDTDAPGAFEVIGEQEKFDLIVSNPPWEDDTPEKLLDYAFFDPSYALLESLLGGVESHLQPRGRCLLAYGCVSGIRKAVERAPHYQLRAEIRDDRDLDQLPEVFVPGMLIEVWPSKLNHPSE